MRSLFLLLTAAVASPTETVLKMLIANPNADLTAFGEDATDYESIYHELVDVTRAPSELVEFLMSELRYPFALSDLDAIASGFPEVTAECVFAFAMYCIAPIRAGELNPCDPLPEDNSVWTLSDARKIEYYKYRLRNMNGSR